MKKISIAISAVALAASSVVVALPAQAVPGNAADLLSGGGGLRLRMYYNANGSGPTYSAYAPPCTATTSDIDQTVGNLNLGAGVDWDKQATAWADFSPCDVYFYTKLNNVPPASSLQNSGGAITQFSSTYDRKVQSYKLT